MTAPEHVAEEQKLLARTQREMESMTDNTFDETIRVCAVTAHLAQAHATLAVAMRTGG